MEIRTERRDTDYNYSDSNSHEDQYLVLLIENI
jgi:hypothetical protein